mmetsp:Transcript_47398/g.122467  ORF Transcript_47398/g.122467 Transcript_47398/m.122467 type:complete len:214 (+) Transcript_47398:758-1399(+)
MYTPLSIEYTRAAWRSTAPFGSRHLPTSGPSRGIPSESEASTSESSRPRKWVSAWHPLRQSGQPAGSAAASTAPALSAKPSTARMYTSNSCAICLTCSSEGQRRWKKPLLGNTTEGGRMSVPRSAVSSLVKSDWRRRRRQESSLHPAKRPLNGYRSWMKMRKWKNATSPFRVRSSCSMVGSSISTSTLRSAGELAVLFSSEPAATLRCCCCTC